MKFKVVAERPGPLMVDGRPIPNPFLIRDIFAPNLRTRVERRTWDALEANSERELREMFGQAVAGNINDMRGFRLVSVDPSDDA